MALYPVWIQICLRWSCHKMVKRNHIVWQTIAEILLIRHWLTLTQAGNFFMCCWHSYEKLFLCNTRCNSGHPGLYKKNKKLVFFCKHFIGRLRNSPLRTEYNDLHDQDHCQVKFSEQVEVAGCHIRRIRWMVDDYNAIFGQIIRRERRTVRWRIIMQQSPACFFTVFWPNSSNARYQTLQNTNIKHRVWPVGTNSLCIYPWNRKNKLTLTWFFWFLTSLGDFFFGFGSSRGCHFEFWRLVLGSYWKHHVSSPVTMEYKKFRFFFASLMMSLECWILRSFSCGFKVCGTNLAQTFTYPKFSVKIR